MENVAKLVQKYRLVKICRIGAWIVAIFGVAQIAAALYNSWVDYQQTQANLSQILPPNQIYNSPIYRLIMAISPLFGTVVYYTFYFIVLYAASVIFQAISIQPATANATGQSATANEPELDGASSGKGEDDIVYTSLKREDIARDRQQINNHKSAGHLS